MKMRRGMRVGREGKERNDKDTNADNRRIEG